jgi:stage II sporulation protein D
MSDLNLQQIQKIVNIKIMKKIILAICYASFIRILLIFPENVRINLVHYSRLKDFEIKLDKSSELIIDEKKNKTSKIKILPEEKKIIFGNNSARTFNKIKIIAKKPVSFISFSGTANYKGIFYINAASDKIKIINEIPSEDYFAGVLGAEMGESFSIEALKALSIAARTYFYNKKTNYSKDDFDINNSDGVDMVYRGTDFASAKMYEAFNGTKDLYLVDKNGSLIVPYFHSTSGGIILKDKVMTSKIDENIEDPVLLLDADENGLPLSKDSPYFEFFISLKSSDIIHILSPKIKLENLKEIRLKYFINTDCVDYIGFADQNDRILWIKAYDFISLAQKKNFFNLHSIQFNITKDKENYFFKGRGFGHLCGLSQYSAEKLALKGYSYLEILKKYYPDYNIKKIPKILNYQNISNEGISRK